MPIKYVALLALALPTINRFYAVVNPNRSQVFSRRRSLCYVNRVWCLWVLIVVSVLAGIAISSKTKITGTCNLLKATQGKLQKCTFGIILICMSTVTIYNMKIWSFLRNHNRRIAQQNILPTDVIKARNIKLAKTVGAIFVSYVIGYIFPVVFLGFKK